MNTTDPLMAKRQAAIRNRKKTQKKGESAPRSEPSIAAAACEADKVKVRSATAADAPALSALWMELNRNLASVGKEWEITEGAGERIARSVQAGVANPRSLYLVAEMEIDGSARMAGFLHATVKLRNPVFRQSVVGEIAAIFVPTDASGQGVGTALVTAAMDWFRRRGIENIETLIAATDSRGRAFYEAAGFHQSALVFFSEIPQGTGVPQEEQAVEHQLSTVNG
jgi:GNAT superfamily N-acetyltransferase